LQLLNGVSKIIRGNSESILIWNIRIIQYYGNGVIGKFIIRFILAIQKKIQNENYFNDWLIINFENLRYSQQWIYLSRY